MRIHRFFVMFILIAGITLLHGAPLWAGQIRLTWNAPTTNTNGTGVSDHGGLVSLLVPLPALSC
jgi:hypothetical protein